MADEVREEDEWLYGESEQPKVEPTEPFDGETAAEIDYKHSMGELPNEDGTAANARLSNEQEGDTPAEDANNEGETEDDDDDDDSDDDGVQVVIGDIKAGQSTFAQAAKRVGPPPDKKGKFSVEDFESSGTINGVPAQDFSLDSMEEKPWRKPGADITDYFNYGFTEDTWRAYCDRQKRLRYESGTNLPTMMSQGKHQTQDSRGLIPVAISNDNSKYAGQSNIVFPKKFGMQGQGRKEDMMMNRRREEPKENTIQVMTADRREYSRKAFDMPPPIAPPFDMSVPPPSFPPPDAYIGGAPEFFNPHQPPPQFYHEEHGGDYEEQNWMDSSWNMEIGMPSGPGASSSVVSLTKATTVPPPPGESVDDSSPSVSSKDDKKSKSDK